MTQSTLLCTHNASRQTGVLPLPSTVLAGLPARAMQPLSSFIERVIGGWAWCARLVHERRQLGLREQAAGEAAQVRDGEAGDRRVAVARRGHQMRRGGRPQPPPHQAQAAQVGAGRGRQAAQRVRPAHARSPGLGSAGRAARQTA